VTYWNRMKLAFFLYGVACTLTAWLIIDTGIDMYNHHKQKKLQEQATFSAPWLRQRLYDFYAPRSRIPLTPYYEFHLEQEKLPDGAI